MSGFALFVIMTAIVLVTIQAVKMIKKYIK